MLGMGIKGSYPDVGYLTIFLKRNNKSIFYGLRVIPVTPLTECSIYYRKYILQIVQPSQYRCTRLQYRFAAISETFSISSLFQNICGALGSAILTQKKNLKRKRTKKNIKNFAYDTREQNI